MICWRCVDGGVFRTNIPFDRLHITPSHRGKCNLDCRKNSVENRSNHYRKEGIVHHGDGDGDPGGKEGEGVKPMSESGWKTINIQAGTSQTSASLFV